MMEVQLRCFRHRHYWMWICLRPRHKPEVDRLTSRGRRRLDVTSADANDLLRFRVRNFHDECTDPEIEKIMHSCGPENSKSPGKKTREIK